MLDFINRFWSNNKIMARFAVILTQEDEDRNKKLGHRILKDYQSIQVNSGFYIISSKEHTFESLARELGIGASDGAYAIVSELRGNYYGFMPDRIKSWLKAGKGNA